MNTIFKSNQTREEKIAEQVDSAKHIIRQHPSNKMPALVTENRLTKRHRKTFFGWRFCPTLPPPVGAVLENSDGSYSKVVAVVPATAI